MAQLVANQLVFRKALNGPRAVYSIAKHQKLYLATDGKGGGSWRIKYLPPGSKTQRWKTITNDARHVAFDQVVQRASELLTGLALKGVDPKAHTTAPAETFGSAFALWLERHAKEHKKSWAADEALYRRHIAARLGNDNLRSINRARVIEVLNGIAERRGKDDIRPIQANRCQSLISAVFSWALDEGLVESHPALRIRRRGAETQRDQVLTDAELREFWMLLERDYEVHVQQVIKLLLLLGSRLNEIASIEIRELNMNGPRYWTLPAERSKNNLPNIVPLHGVAGSLIEDALVANNGSKFLFPARQATGAFDKKFVSRLCKKIFKAVGRDDMRLHDLRHQAATGMARCGVPTEIRQMVQNQVTGRNRSIGSVYDQHDYFSEKQRALKLWEQLLSAIVTNKELPQERY